MVITIIRRVKRKRITKQIRIVADVHEKILAKAEDEGLTLSKTIEKICRHYFSHEIE